MNISNEYIAGFFDGEGCIGIYRMGNGYRLNTQLSQNRSKNSEIIFNYLRNEYGGAYGIHNTQWKDFINWQLTNQSAANFLKVIIPFLVLKKQQAEVAIKWIDSHPYLNPPKKRDAFGKFAGGIVNGFVKDIGFKERTIQVADTLKELKRSDPSPEQESLELTISYIAGFFDGVGCVGLYERNNKKSATSYFNLMVRITQNESKLSHFVMNCMNRIFDGSVIYDKNENHMVLRWGIYDAKAYQFLIKIEPYLILKKKQVQLAIQWQNLRPGIIKNKKGQVVKTDEAFTEYSRETANAIKALKR